MIILFADTETTGLEVTEGHELIELAVCRWEDGAVTELFDRGFLPVNGCPAEAAKINGYSEAAWLAAGARHFAISDAKELAEIFAGAYIGGSNPDFDKRHIQAACHRVGQPNPKWSHRSLNTASLAWPLWAQGLTESTGLGALTKFFGIEHAAHSAMGDVLASIKVWEALHDLYLHQPARMREALEAILEQAHEDGDLKLETFAREAVA